MKSYLDLSGLSRFLGMLSSKFSTLGHTHKETEIIDLLAISTSEIDAICGAAIYTEEEVEL